MNLLGVASAMGVPTNRLSRLLGGEASAAVAARLGTMSFSVQAFIDGEVRVGMANAMGLSTSAAQELRSGISRDVAIGIVIGLCLDRPPAVSAASTGDAG